jgi:hypothetical protein
MPDELDEELTRAFAGTRAPAHLAFSILRRVRTPAPPRLPEVLDAIGWMGILSLAACVTFFVILK